MSAFMNLAKLRAAMTVCNIDYTNNGQPLTALPTILTALNATFTRASTKTVVQNGALVTLAANQFGTTYDDVTGKYARCFEPAATNLYVNSGWTGGSPPTGTTELSAGGASSATYSASTFAPTANSATFTATAGYRFIYRNFTSAANTTYRLSVRVESVSGGLTAQKVMYTNTAINPVGCTFTFPVCSANPAGGEDGVLQAGVLVIQFVTAAAGGAIQACFGAGAHAANTTGSVTLSCPQAETGLRVTSWILTPSAATAARAADVLIVPLWVNNLLNSGDISQATWSKTNTSVGATVGDGGQLLSRTSIAAAAYTQRTLDTTWAVGTTLTLSAKVKLATTGNLFGMRITGTYPNRVDVVANLSTGAITFASGSTYTLVGSSISAADADGYYRISVTCTAVTSAVASVQFGSAVASSNAWEGTSATLLNCYVKEMQLEPGSVATTYRSTTATRESAANANITGFSSAGYTLFIDGRLDTPFGATVSGRAISVDDGSGSNVASINFNNTAQQIAAVAVGGAVVASIAESVTLARYKRALSCQLDSFKSALNGVAGAEDIAGEMPVSPTTLRFCRYDNTQQANSFVFADALITQPLTQAQLNGLSTL